jgi:hypothetical protein
MDIEQDLNRLEPEPARKIWFTLAISKMDPIKADVISKEYLLKAEHSVVRGTCSNFAVWPETQFAPQGS